MALLKNKVKKKKRCKVREIISSYIVASIQCYSVLSDIVVKMSYAYRWKGDQMFYLLVKVSFAYLLPVSLKSLCFSVLSTK